MIGFIFSWLGVALFGIGFAGAALSVYVRRLREKAKAADAAVQLHQPESFARVSPGFSPGRGVALGVSWASDSGDGDESGFGAAALRDRGSSE